MQNVINNVSNQFLLSAYSGSMLLTGVPFMDSLILGGEGNTHFSSGVFVNIGCDT